MLIYRSLGEAERRSVWRWCAMCVSCVIVGAGAPVGAQQQSGAFRDPAAVYRAGVELVVLNVAVLDDEGEPVAGLSADDFRLRQDGDLQEITLFASSEDSPLDVALVIDASGSIRQSAPTVREDAKAFLAALGPKDCVYFVPFQEHVRQTMWASPADRALAILVAAMPLFGGTALYDAVFQGLRGVDRTHLAADGTVWEDAQFDGAGCGSPLPPPGLGIPGTLRRTAVVVLSDGADEHSVATYADAMGNAWSYPVPIFSVAIGGAVAPDRRRPTRAGSVYARSFRRRQEYAEALESRLSHLAYITGGRLILGDEKETLRESFEEVVTMLRSSYLVGYRPPEDADADGKGGLIWHRIELEAPGHDADLFVRPGYYRRLFDTRGAERIVTETDDWIREGRAVEAEPLLDLAIRLDPGYWPAYLQRARVLLRLQRPEDALADLQTLLELRPGVGTAHALASNTAYMLTDYELAWHHGIRAYQDGVQVATLLRGLQAVSEPPDDLQTELAAPRLFIDVGPAPDELDQGTLLEVYRALGTAISEAPDLGLTSVASEAEFRIILQVEKVEGEPRKLEGELVINGAPYQRLEDENLEIEDVDDPAAIAEGIRRTLDKVRGILKRYGA